MTSEPRIETRAEQPYVAIRVRLAMTDMHTLGGRHREVFGWLSEHGLTPAGPPLLRFLVIDMARELEIDLGVPVAVPVTVPVPGDDRVVPGVLPAGRYATLIHTGHPSELMEATKTLLEWAAGQGLSWDMSPGEDGERWGCRLENYLTDPAQEPDMSKWETELAFRLAG